ANITLAATGERSWAEAGIAIAGAALSLIGLGGAAKAAMGLSKSIAKGAFKGGFKQAMKKGWCKLGFGACFVAGTPVLTVDGVKPIQDIVVGDKVWTRNLDTGLDELQLVAETFVHQALALYHLTIDDQRVSTTAEHPFMTADRGWQMAGNLHPGDLLVTPEGTTVLQAVQVEEHDLADIVEVYNFHVENTHTYYVLAGDTPLLVHNAHGDDAVRAQVNKHIDDYVEGAVDSTDAGARMTNVRTPGTHDEYVRKLTDDGWSSRTTGRDNEITLLEKDGHKAAVREKAGSWEGWTSEYTTPGNKKADLKIRFGASE
ncbi:polymorphic toxin-type HINT domain-containing protein, partial [Promicromonospora sp. NPDC050880]|uniref:polymorphic toxin-type HINT domain-containing protein n=1 Tax=Promicromonospora sp. NPDC050880 TaxID=3364406 RepID=UPI00378F95B1